MLDAKLPYLVEPASCRGINAIFKCVNSLDSLTAETDLIDCNHYSTVKSVNTKQEIFKNFGFLRIGLECLNKEILKADLMNSYLQWRVTSASENNII
jgi:hypothetical protein